MKIKKVKKAPTGSVQVQKILLEKDPMKNSPYVNLITYGLFFL
jgi:hypothetical protein